MNRILGLASGLVVVGIAGCTEAPVEPDPQPDVVEFAYPEAALTPQIDLLMVVDSSPAMAAHRDRLDASYRRFTDVIETIGGLPDLHLAVVTADLGGPGCGPGGDAAFRHAAMVAGDYVIDGPISSSTRGRNYDGELGIAVAALADAGSAGCAIAQPLAAMERALQAPSSFRRPGATLAVMFVSASDDASSISVDEAEAFLRSLDTDPRGPIVSVVGGPEAGSCATPAIRLRALADRFPDRSSFTSICAAEHQDAIAILGTAYLSLLALPCITDPLADVDLAMPGPQYDCTVCDVYQVSSGAEADQELAACDASASNRPCWRFRTGLPGCDGLSLHVERPFLPVPGTNIVGQCAKE